MSYATLKQLNALSKGMEGKTLFTQEDVSLNIENIKKLSDCEKFSFVDFMNLLNLKDATVSLTTALTSLIYKIGTTIHGGTTLTATVTKGSYDISQIEFFVDNTSIGIETVDVANGGVYSCGYGLDITTNKEFKVVVTDINGNEIEDTIEVNFYNPYYYGHVDKDLVDITETDVLTMTQIVNKKGNQKLKYTMSNERAIFAYDKSYGDLISILDPNNFENLSSFSKVEMTLDGVLCNVYIQNEKCYCTNFEYNFKF